jgi:hypothetical protein
LQRQFPAAGRAAGLVSPDAGSLADAQSSFVAAVTGGNESLAGFEPQRVKALARILVAKRLKAAARACPPIDSALGQSLPGLFGRYASEMPATSGASPTDDARRFLEWLARHRILPRELRWIPLRLRVKRVVRHLLAR